MNLAPLSIRLFCDLASPGMVVDLNRGSAAASFYRGDDIEFDIGIGENGALFTGLNGSGAGGIASVSLQIFQSENDTNAPMISSTVLSANMNLGLTQAQWTNDTAPFYHAAFVIPGSLTAIGLNGASSVNYWLRITAATSDATPKTITILDGPITVRDGPISTASVPPLAAFRLYTVNGQAVPQLLDTSTGLYHTLAILNEGGGELTLQISDQGY